MIEFQLTIYMCSHCTRVHNAAHDCVFHELEEHPPSTGLSEVTTAVNHHQALESFREVDDPREPSTSSAPLPFTIIDDDVKPDMDDSDLQRQRVLVERNESGLVVEENQVMKSTEKHSGETVMPPTAMNKDDKSENRPRSSRPLYVRQPRISAPKSIRHTGGISKRVSCRICGKVCWWKTYFRYSISDGFTEQHGETYANSHWREAVQMYAVFYAIYTGWSWGFD